MMPGKISRRILLVALLSLIGICDYFLLAMASASVADPGAWAGFVPDLVVAVITTGGLGVVLVYLARRLEATSEDRAERREVQREWRAAWFHLSEVSAIEQDVRANLHGLNRLGLGTHLATIDGARIHEWLDRFDTRELRALSVAAQQCRFAVQSGAVLERRIEELAVRGTIRNALEPATVKVAMRGLILNQAPGVRAELGNGTADEALLDATKLLSDDEIQRHVDRYRKAVQDSYDLSAKWLGIHFEAMGQALGVGLHSSLFGIPPEQEHDSRATQRSPGGSRKS